MLGKLFKHDMRQTAKMMLPFMIFVFGTTILGTAALKFAREAGFHFNDSAVVSFLSISLYFIFGFSVFALLAYAVLAVFLSVSRYYKNLFTDEGYLTFTLPVNSSTLIFSKLWSTLIWTLLSVVVVIACIFIYVTFGGAPIGKVINVDFYKGLGDIVLRSFKWLFSKHHVSYVFMVAEIVVLEFVASIYGILSLFLAITVGSIIAKKHKILASIGVYYLINAVVSTVTTVFLTILTLGTIAIYTDQIVDTAVIHLYMVGILFTYAVIMVVEFLITNYLLKKKLNLQ